MYNTLYFLKINKNYIHSQNIINTLINILSTNPISYEYYENTTNIIILFDCTIEKFINILYHLQTNNYITTKLHYIIHKSDIIN